MKTAMRQLLDALKKEGYNMDDLDDHHFMQLEKSQMADAFYATVDTQQPNNFIDFYSEKFQEQFNSMSAVEELIAAVKDSLISVANEKHCNYFLKKEKIQTIQFVSWLCNTGHIYNILNQKSSEEDLYKIWKSSKN